MQSSNISIQRRLQLRTKIELGFLVFESLLSPKQAMDQTGALAFWFRHFWLLRLTLLSKVLQEQVLQRRLQLWIFGSLLAPFRFAQISKK